MSKLLSTLLAILFFQLIGTIAASAQNSSAIRTCTGGNETLSVIDNYRSGQPGFHHQEFTLGEGRYTLTAKSDRNFRFNAFFYIRDNASEKWKSTKATNDIVASSQNFVMGAFGGQVLLQAVKTSNNCPNCQLSAVLQSRSCPNSNSQRSTPRSRNSDKACPVNQCFSQIDFLYGLPSCQPQPGWDGSACP